MSPVEPATRRSPALRWARAAVRVALVGAVLYFVGRHVAANLDALRDARLAPAPLPLALAVVALVVSQLVFGALYPLLMRDHPRPPTLLQGFALTVLPGLGRYVPGKVGVLVGTVWAFERWGWERRLGLALLLYIQVALIAGGLIAGVAFSLGVAGPSAAALSWLRLAPLLALPGLPLLHPGLLRRGLALFERLTGLPALALGFPARRAPAALGLAALGMALSGVGFALLAVSLGATPATAGELAALIGIYPLALCLGFLVLVAPAGLGVRDGVLMVGLQPLIGVEAAIVASLAVRLVQIAVDVGTALLGLLVVRRVPAAPAADAVGGDREGRA